MKNLSSQGSSGSDLTNRVLFTLAILFICRIGSYIPIAGIDSVVLSEVAARHQEGVLGMLNMLSGGSLGRMSIFALAIMPFITASIIMQLLTISFKPLEEMKKDGEAGRAKITQLSRYLTIVLAGMQAYGLASSLLMEAKFGSVVVIDPTFFKITTVTTLTVGTMFLMWLGEQITARGIGNGSSLIIFIGIVSGLPSAVISTFELSRKGGASPIMSLVVCVSIVALIALIVFFERAQRKVLIQYPKRQVGNKIYGGDSNHMPLKLNTSGVIPPIFAGALLGFPLTMARFSSSESPLVEHVLYYLGHGKPLYMLLYAGLIIGFSFLYTAIMFNSEETSNNLRKYGAYIPGKRPGPSTATYFDYLLTRLTVMGALYLCVVCIIPEVFMNKFSLAFSLGGTSLLIVVNVVIDTFTQIQTHMFSGRYEGLIRKMKIKG
jgi:preprotein translocase subunit SecY